MSAPFFSSRGRFSLSRRLLTASLFCIAHPPLSAAAAAPAALPPEKVKIEGVAVHPTVYITASSVARARENVRKHDWARDAADEITSAADVWLGRSDEWIRARTPGPGACFSYGFTGCPVCGGSLGMWKNANASFDDPGHVRCSGGHRLPDEDHPDTGAGYLAKDGRIHYFAGSYNAWVVETLTFDGADALAHAYTLTGKEAYAEKAAVILDALADVYPTCTTGSWDYPDKRNSGRFNRPQYQVARVLVHYVNQFDQIFNSPALDVPSVRAGLTRRENIERNLIRDGGYYCYKRSFGGGLSNGVADYQRGALAAGAVLGIPEYVRSAVDGPYGILTMLDNNVGRDGSYYETASGYAWHARELYVHMAGILGNLKVAPYPDGLDLYRNPKFASFLFLHNLRINCTGFTPSYGDAAPLTKWQSPSSRPFDATDYSCLEKLYAASENPARRTELASLMNWVTDGDPLARRAGVGIGIDPKWLLFNARDIEPAKTAVPSSGERLLASDFLGQKGFAVLRAGRDADAQAVLFRFGPSLGHGNYDDLHFSYYGLGHDLTYDIGYLLASSHAYRAWSKHTASHNLVVVNEASQGAVTTDFTGGSMELFADLPDVGVAEASCESSYASQGVTLYRRALALVGDPDTTHTYLVDLFRVRGGTKHDYFFHGLGDRTEFEGLAFGGTKPGSLAGEDVAWGDKILIDGDIQGHPNKPYWNAPPGNGYGFLVEPREAVPAGGWSADWKIGTGDARLRMAMAADPGTSVVTAWGPGLLPTLPKARYAVARRAGENLASVFVSASEPHNGEPQILSVEKLPVEGPETTVPAVAVRVRLRGGAEDLLYFAPDEEERRAAGMRLAGRFIRLRIKDGKVLASAGVGARLAEGGGFRSASAASGWSGTAAGVDADQGIVTTDLRLPSDGSLRGRPVYFSNPAWSRSTVYRIDRIEADGAGSKIVLAETCRLGVGRVDALTTEGIRTWSPHEYARAVSRTSDTGFFRGKRIRTPAGASARIRRMENGAPMTLVLDGTEGLKTGDTFTYDDLAPGDAFRIDATGW